MRAFISINMPDEVRRKIKEIQDKLPDFRGKKTELENLHLTLKFLGEIEEKVVGEVKKRLREIKIEKFETEIDEIGIFSEKFIRIIWLHIKDCDALQKQIDGALKNLFEPEGRFMSHLTIARVKNVRNRDVFIKKLKKMKIEKIRFKIDKFYLMKSELTEEGPKYSIIEKYNLS